MLNEALRLIQISHDLKQGEAAERLGVSPSYLSEIEKGRKVPTLDLLNRYAAAFDIPLSSIMFFSEHMGETQAYQKAKTFVAAKIIALLKFLEERGRGLHAE